ncbi:UNVERIFIED_CONTAM: hypothetical protein K2H54_030281 [Gekko kuhli]
MPRNRNVLCTVTGSSQEENGTSQHVESTPAPITPAQLSAAHATEEFSAPLSQVFHHLILGAPDQYLIDPDDPECRGHLSSIRICYLVNISKSMPSVQSYM